MLSLSFLNSVSNILKSKSSREILYNLNELYKSKLSDDERAYLDDLIQVYEAIVESLNKAWKVKVALKEKLKEAQKQDNNKILKPKI